MKYKLTVIIVLLCLGTRAQQVVETNRYNNERELTSNGAVVLKPGFTVTAGSNLRVYIKTEGGMNIGTKTNGQMNAIVTYTAKQPSLVNIMDTANTVTQVDVEVQTFDHFGRVKEVQKVKTTPDLNDLIQLKSYDAAGNESVINLPYVQPRGWANFHSQGYTAAGYNYYNSLDTATSSSLIGDGSYGVRYDNSPLSRLKEQGAPGSAFNLAGHHTKRTELMIGSWGNVPAFIPNSWGVLYVEDGWQGVYNPYALRTVRTQDENTPYRGALEIADLVTANNPGSSYETTNYLGQVMVKQVYKDDNNSLVTSYIYSKKNNLSVVLPPKYFQTGNIADTAQLNALAYQYQYDDQDRMIIKKLPGKGMEYMVYNSLNQVVMSQDAVQRSKSPQQWNVIKYDSQGRVALTGIYNHSGSSANTNYRATMQTAVNAQSAEWESRTGSGNGYTANTYPAGIDVLSVNYYDDYDFPVTNPYPYAAGSKLTRGLPTATRTTVLGTTDQLWAITYYDDDSRAIKVFKQHYKGGSFNTNNYDELTSTYDFTGKVTTATRSHKVGNTETLKTLDEYTYDHAGRKLDSWQTINMGTRTLIARNQYDALGNLYKKHLHSTNGTTFLQTITYGYNQRGWLIKASAPKFDYKLRYTTPTQGATPQYNGNIAEQEYTGKYSGNKWFKYSYDTYNRLTDAVYKTDSLSERLTYDRSGNILTLKRGLNSNTAISYTYNAGNRLNSVSGGMASTFGYNINGNILTDSYRNVTGMVYNHLNLPVTVTGSGKSASYTYDAAGSKLASAQTFGSTTTTRDYISGLQYKDGNIEFIATEEGRA
ncbi:MAG: DUF6443 domain-containing protein, partial [Bacteroidota bacterium]